MCLSSGTEPSRKEESPLLVVINLYAFVFKFNQKTLNLNEIKLIGKWVFGSIIN